MPDRAGHDREGFPPHPSSFDKLRAGSLPHGEREDTAPSGLAALEEDAIDADANGVYTCVMRGRPQTVVETPAYLTAAQGVLSEAERAGVVTMVAENPEAGVSLGGGIRKVRIARAGGGKRGGARVVFLFAGEDIPVFLLTVFAKNEKTDLSARERTALIAAAKQMVEDYRRHQ